MSLEIVLASGMLTGLASSLHCAGLCGGVAAMFVPAPEGAGAAHLARLSFLLRMQIGRAAVYIAAGSVAGSLGYSIEALLPLEGVQGLLRWMAAAMIALTGLSTAGFMPPLGRLDRVLGPMQSLRRLAGRLPVTSAIGLGAGLALAPCAMVLNALLTAILFGGAVPGLVYMAGFSLTALPGVVLAALGITSLAAGGQYGGRRLRRVLGILLLLCGVGFALVPGASLASLCLG
jgi:hypothetical protein